MHGSAKRDALADRRYGVALAAENERQSAAIALAHHDHDLPLAGLFFGDASVDAVLDLIFRLPIAAKVCAVNFARGGQFCLALFVLNRLSTTV
jgi:hypothetical protein